jgi:hypothetical protein
MDKRARKLVLILLLAALGPVAALLSALFAYDPLALFHEPWGRPGTVHENMRLQAAGVIRHGDFDSVILGTSILENTSAEEASRILGGRFVNLSVSAGDFFERGLILRHLLERRPVRQVIYSLDFIYLNQRKGYWYYPLPTYDFLYDANPFNDIRAYLNGHFLGCLARGSREPACVGRETDLDRPNAWMKDPEQAARFGGFDAWCQARDNSQIRDVYAKMSEAAAAIRAGAVQVSDPAQTALAIDYVERNLITLVREFPQTRFHLVFPPYSRAKFAIWHQYRQGDAAAHLAVIRYLAASSSRLPNLQVSGFEDQDFLDDIARYKDMDHFDPEINTLIARSIGQGAHRITPMNVEHYIAEATRRAREYPLDEMAARLGACIEPPAGAAP